jgi:hypothetical protein
MLINIQPFVCYVRSEFIFDDMNGQPYFQDGTAFAISAKSNETLKFQIMVGEGRIHPEVSVAALTSRQEAVKLIDDACSYTVFPDDKVSIVVLDYLSTLDTCGVLNKDGSFWQNGQYLFTVEWDNLKKQLHLIGLDDGNYVFWGNEGLVWGE